MRLLVCVTKKQIHSVSPNLHPHLLETKCKSLRCVVVAVVVVSVYIMVGLEACGCLKVLHVNEGCVSPVTDLQPQEPRVA